MAKLFYIRGLPFAALSYIIFTLKTALLNFHYMFFFFVCIVVRIFAKK